MSVPRLHPDDQPGADADELESLAREWGMRRGVDEPLAVLHRAPAAASRGRRRATGSGEDLVEVWFISDGTTMMKATYVCPWADA